MEDFSQEILLDIPERAAPEQEPPARQGQAKLKAINRQQTMLAVIYVEELIPADHKARAIWELTGRMDLSGFTEPLRTAQGQSGRPAWDPRLLVSLWVYAYSEGIGSAREIERVMEWGRVCSGWPGWMRSIITLCPISGWNTERRWMNCLRNY